MNEKQLEIVAKARAIAESQRAASNGKGMEHVSNGKNVAPTHGPNAKVENQQAEGDNKQRSLPKEQQQQRGQQQSQRSPGRGR